MANLVSDQNIEKYFLHFYILCFYIPGHLVYLFGTVLQCNIFYFQATETVFRMAVTRGILNPIKHGEVWQNL